MIWTPLADLMLAVLTSRGRSPAVIAGLAGLPEAEVARRLNDLGIGGGIVADAAPVPRSGPLPEGERVATPANRVLDAVLLAEHSGTVQASYATVLRWAGERGLAPAREGMDLDAVNRKRAALGLLPFENVRGRAA